MSATGEREVYSSFLDRFAPSKDHAWAMIPLVSFKDSIEFKIKRHAGLMGWPSTKPRRSREQPAEDHLAKQEYAAGRRRNRG